MTKSGQSAALMALRGIDIDNPRTYEKKEIYHYFDGESNINLLINYLTKLIDGKDVLPQVYRIMAFDGLNFELNCT